VGKLRDRGASEPQREDGVRAAPERDGRPAQGNRTVLWPRMVITSESVA
jgi:hypothetical protein